MSDSIKAPLMPPNTAELTYNINPHLRDEPPSPRKMLVQIEQSPFHFQTWLLTQIRGLNVGNIALLISVLIISLQVRSQLDDMRGEMQRANQSNSILANTTFQANTSISIMHDQIAILDGVKADVSNFQSALDSASAAGLPLLSNFTQILATRLKEPFICGYAGSWTAPPPSGQGGYEGTNNLCKVDLKASLKNPPLASCTNKAHVCTSFEILWILQRDIQLPVPSSIITSTSAWINTMTISYSVVSAESGTLNSSQPGDCYGWWSVNVGPGAPSADVVVGTTVYLPSAGSPFPSASVCSAPHPFACCDSITP